jgi:RHS repeat-associated protein
MRSTFQNTNLNYYTFGSAIAARAFSSGDYRYGFNGMEKDSENNSGAYDFGARIYDGRLGRWLAVDPFFEGYPFISTYNFALNSVLQFVDSDGERVYFVIVSGIDADIQDAAKTREGEILNSSDFDKNKDRVYVIQISDLGKLKEEVAKNVKDAKEKGYGLTVESSFFSHAGGDGPQGTEETSKNSLKSVTGSDIDRKQLSPTGWKDINFNYDPKESVAAFYGCNTDDFAQKYLNYSNVKYTAGVDGRAGGSKTFEGKFNSTILNIFWDNPYKVYMVSISNPCDMDINAKCDDLVNPRNVYSRDSKNATYKNKGKDELIKLIDVEGTSHTLKKPSEIKGNVTVDRETKKVKSGS